MVGTAGRRGEDGRTATLTFLFSDIEGSTLLLRAIGERYGDVLERCRALQRAAVAEGGGWEVDAEGDGLFSAFPSAVDAVAAAAAAQREHAAEAWPDDAQVRVRMGLHTGEVVRRGGGYVGLDVHRAARIAAAAHGGQVLLSDSVRALVHGRLPDEVELRDLGEHRLPDLAAPERLWQLVVEGLPPDFPPVRALDATPNNLPTQLTSFVGRDREVPRAQELLAATRLLTLTGPGGTGKTRLALQVAACLANTYADGVFFVPLSAVRDPALVAPAVLDALRVRQAPARDPAEQLADYLADREVLLLLDNFEQLLDAAAQVAALLRAAPRLRVLVTSRAPLRVSGEQELAVGPLPVPDPTRASAETLAAYDAVTLFIQRARAVAPDFVVDEHNAPAIAEICARLDGLPLAIELAAARVKLLPPEAMLARLDKRLSALGVGPRDLPARQQTLRGAIRWSYDLLDDDGRRLFSRLAVFTGGWTLEQAEEVCGEDLDVLSELEGLVDHSLVRRRVTDHGVRFMLLETIREFAAELLEDDGEADGVRARHASAFLRLAETAAPHLLGREQARWVATLAVEEGNCRAALAWLVERGDADCALRMGAALWRYWQKRSVREGRARLAAVLAMPGVEEHPRALVGALDAAGGLAYWDGDQQAVGRLYQQQFAVAERLDDPRALADARYNLAFDAILGEDRDSGRAEALLRDALESYRALGHRDGEAKAGWGLGVNTFFDGRLEEAEALLLAALEVARDLDDTFHVGWSLHMLAMVHTRTGDHAQARRRLDEALGLFAEATDHAAVTLLLDDYAELAGILGDGRREATLAAASQALQDRSGSELSRVAGELAGRVPVEPERFAAAWAAGLAMSFDEAVAYALKAEEPD